MTGAVPVDWLPRGHFMLDEEKELLGVEEEEEVVEVPPPLPPLPWHEKVCCCPPYCSVVLFLPALACTDAKHVGRSCSTTRVSSWRVCRPQHRMSGTAWCTDRGRNGSGDRKRQGGARREESGGC